MPKDRPQFMYECPCGYSLKAALRFMSQAEVSQLMVNHIQSMHMGVDDE